MVYRVLCLWLGLPLKEEKRPHILLPIFIKQKVENEDLTLYSPILHPLQSIPKIFFP